MERRAGNLQRHQLACGGPFCDGWMGTAPVGVHSVMGGWVQHLWGSVL